MRWFLLWFLAFSLSLWSQGARDAFIKGKVVDEKSVPMAKVDLFLTGKTVQMNRKGSSDQKGNFSLGTLLPGTYLLEAKKEGHLPIQQTLTLSPGDVLQIKIILPSLSFGETVEVKVKTQVLTPDGFSEIQGETLTQLPLLERDILSLLPLMPQTVEDDQGRFHIGGGRGIFTTYGVDGHDGTSNFFAEPLGGKRPTFTFPLSAVESLQTAIWPYSPAYQNAVGGMVNLITRSATSPWHGEATLQYRDEAWMAKDGLGREAEDFSQVQGGLNGGGRIYQDKLFIFLAGDTQRFEHPTYRSFDDPTGALEDPENRAYLEQFISLNKETGTIAQTNDVDSFFLKPSWQMSPQNHLTLRWNTLTFTGENLSDPWRTTGWSNNGTEEDRIQQIALDWLSMVSPALAHTFRLTWSKENRPRNPNVTGIPEVVIGNWEGVFGQKNYLPTTVKEDNWKIGSHWWWNWGEHAFQWGGEFGEIDYTDDFFRYQAGSYWYASWDAFFEGLPSYFTQAFSPIDGKVDFSETRWALYFSDTWSYKNFSVMAGFRYEHQGFSDPPYPNPQLLQSQRVIEDELLSPRIMARTLLDKGGKWGLRGGWGLFQGTTPALLTANAYLFNGEAVKRYSLYEGDPNMPVFPDVLTDPSQLTALTPDVYYFDRGFTNPRLSAWMGEITFEPKEGHTFSLTLTDRRWTHLERKRDDNLSLLGDNLYDSHDRPDERFRKMIAFVSDAKAHYQSATLRYRWRGAHHLLDLHYTYSKNRDNDSNERSVSASGDFPSDPWDLNRDWGPADTDVPHRLVVTFTWQIHPRWQVGLLGTYRSGFPYSALSDQDENGDGFINDRPLGRNTFRQPPYRRVDLRVRYNLPIGGLTASIFLDIFNLFNHENLTTDRFTYWTTQEDGSHVLREDFGKPTQAGEPRQIQLGFTLKI